MTRNDADNKCVNQPDTTMHNQDKHQHYNE
jgi:hypothetical protein